MLCLTSHQLTATCQRCNEYNKSLTICGTFSDLCGSSLHHMFVDPTKELLLNDVWSWVIIFEAHHVLTTDR